MDTSNTALTDAELIAHVDHHCEMFCPSNRGNRVIALDLVAELERRCKIQPGETLTELDARITPLQLALLALWSWHDEGE